MTKQSYVRFSKTVRGLTEYSYTFLVGNADGIVNIKMITLHNLHPVVDIIVCHQNLLLSLKLL